uniref:ATP synthase complex subunit 8 n=1 Tax=Mecopoda niponensis TaxID=469652 RepID=M9NJF5_MECNI|nr:ATP synthase F0 subunit 8 [Mecopoda niponensis]AFK15634.1 ATPase subunit 8 [Mecopoda niponensis]
MPQMSPLSWLLLFLMFSFSLMIFTWLNYFIINTQPSNPQPMLLTSSSPLNWKW